jgi:restriction endonuclease S subunit
LENLGFDSTVNKVSIGRFNKDKLSNIEIINPPKEQQKQIVEYIEIATTKSYAWLL